jgi:protein-tyrosine phosphatase
VPARAAGQPAAGGPPVRLLFVCLGNICRSPTAEGAMRTLVHEAGLEGQIELDSAGTGGWHVGDPPDARAAATAARRGIALGGVARQVRPADFEEFDLILAMDSANLSELHRLAPDEHGRAKVRLLREFDPAAGADREVPDPYYGGPGGFDEVLDLVQAACASLLARLAPTDGEARAAPTDDEARAAPTDGEARERP